MALSEHYEFRYVDPDEEMSEFPHTWDYTIDKIDTAIHDAATNNVSVSRLPSIPAGKITSGRFADARIPTSIARKADLDSLIEVDTTAGEKISIDGHIVKYDSGWRDITGSILNDWEGELQIRRTLSELQIAVTDMVAPPSPPNNKFCPLPSGFRPVIPSGNWSTVPLRRTTNTVAFATLSATNMYLNKEDEFQQGFWNMVTVPATEMLPTTLPGSPA